MKINEMEQKKRLIKGQENLFGCRKQMLARCHGMTKEELSQNVTEIMNSISKEEFVRVFLDWMRKLEQVISTSGEDIEISTITIWFPSLPLSTSWRLQRLRRRLICIYETRRPWGTPETFRST
jgi:hypothetical protein